MRKAPRHTAILLLRREPVAQRAFGDWSMGYKQLRVGDLSAFPQYSKSFNFGTNPESIAADAGVALDMLLRFSKGQSPIDPATAPDIVDHQTL